MAQLDGPLPVTVPVSGVFGLKPFIASLGLPSGSRFGACQPDMFSFKGSTPVGLKKDAVIALFSISELQPVKC